MRKIITLLFALTIVFHLATAQHGPQLNENSVVRDTLGNTIPYALWSQLITTARYTLKSDNKEKPEFVLLRLSDEEFEKRLESAPKPRESAFFKTGKKFDHFKTTDIKGSKISTKDLAGKILVINYWFIKCPPCIREIPELNDLVETYKTDSSVVFIAVALDQKDELEQFLKKTRFNYTIIDDGRFIATVSRITSYPTNVVIDPQGKVYFHSSGLSINTAYWIKKSIEELRVKSLAKTDNPNNQ